MKLSGEARIINESVEKKLDEARDLKIKNKFSQAIQMYHKVIFLKEDPQAICELAEIYQTFCDISTALSFYKKCDQINPKPRIKEKIKQLTLIRGLDLLSIGSIKNILFETEFDVFIKRYPFFYRKLKNKIQKNKTENAHLSDHLLSCLAYLQVNHRKLALDAIENCIILDEKDVDLIVMKGLIYWSLFDDRKGYECFWNGYKIDKQNEQIKIFLSLILPQVESLYKQAKYDLIDKQIAKCRIKVKKALQLYPYNTNFLILSSYLHRIKQQYEEALSNLQMANKTLQKDADNSTQLQNQLRNQISLTYNEMGVYLFKQGKFTQAITLFSEGLSYKPKDSGILTNRGDCYRSLNDFVKALQNYEAAYELEKKNSQLNFRIASIYNMRGISLFNSKNFDLAIKEFNESIRYSPKCESFYMSKAKCLIQIGLKGQAIRALEDAERIDGNNSEIKQTLQNLRDNEEKRIRNNKKIIYLSKQK